MRLWATTRRFWAAIMLALALPHADPGGLIICVHADGHRSLEFACGCVEEAAGCACGDCGSSPDPEVFSLYSAEDCGGCTDFSLTVSASAAQPQPQPPALLGLLAAAPVCDLAGLAYLPQCASEKVPRYACGPPGQYLPGSSSVLRI
jgi:hypothetical protein